MKILCVIPARYASTRLPGKPLADIAGKPMIRHVYERASLAKTPDEVLVATDSELVLQAVQDFGGNALLTSPDHPTGTDRLAEVLAKREDIDVVINVQGDEPFLKTEPLKQLIQVFKNDVDKEISLASLKIRLKEKEEIENPNNVKVITDLQNFAMYFSRSVIPYPRETSVEHFYYKHIGVYAFRKEALLKFANLAMTPLEISEKIEAIRYLENGMKIKMIETDFIGVGIDVPEDLEKAKAILSRDKS